jgi:hypothetical protein
MLKFRVLISAALLMAFAASAPTQTDWIGRFLDRYKPLNSASVPQSADEPWRLMVQQSALPISISDVIQLMHASNLDVNVNRFNPITKQYLLNTLFEGLPILRTEKLTC